MFSALQGSNLFSTEINFNTEHDPKATNNIHINNYLFIIIINSYRGWWTSTTELDQGHLCVKAFSWTLVDSPEITSYGLLSLLLKKGEAKFVFYYTSGNSLLEGIKQKYS